MSDTMTPTMIDCARSNCTAVYPPLPVASSLEHLVVTCVLVWLAIGAVIWMVLYSKGIIGEVYRRQGRKPLPNVLASIGAVVGWPVIVGVFLAGVAQGAFRR